MQGEAVREKLLEMFLFSENTDYAHSVTHQTTNIVIQRRTEHLVELNTEHVWRRLTGGWDGSHLFFGSTVVVVCQIMWRRVSLLLLSFADASLHTSKNT